MFYLMWQLARRLDNFSLAGVNRKLSFQTAIPSEFVLRSTWSFSHTFFFGLSCSSGVPLKPSTEILSPGWADDGRTMGSTSV